MCGPYTCPTKNTRGSEPVPNCMVARVVSPVGSGEFSTVGCDSEFTDESVYTVICQCPSPRAKAGRGCSTKLALQAGTKLATESDLCSRWVSACKCSSSATTYTVIMSPGLRLILALSGIRTGVTRQQAVTWHTWHLQWANGTRMCE